MKIFQLILLFVALSFSCYSQKERAPITLKYADSLVGMRGAEGFRIREYVGNVQLEQENIFVKCNKAIQYLDENKAELIGNVVITQEDLILKSPKINYNGNSGVATSLDGISITDKNANLTAKRGTYNTETFVADFEDDVKIKDDSVKISARKISYNRKTRVSFCYGNVKVEDDSVMIFCDTLEHQRGTRDSYSYGNVEVRGKYDNAILFSDTLINIHSDKYIKALGNPLLFQIDTIAVDTLYRYSEGNADKTPLPDTIIYREYDTLSITANIMESFRQSDEEKYIFNDNVEIVRKDIAAKCNLAIFKTNDEFIELYKNPIVWYDSTQLHSDTIFIYTPNKKLSYILALSNSLAAIKDDTVFTDRINQITGYSIKIVFTNDSIDYILSKYDAKSLFFNQNENEDAVAARNSADSIRIIFQDGEPLEFISLGANQGEFFPEVLFYNKEKEYYLPNFRWNNEKPKRKHTRK